MVVFPSSIQPTPAGEPSYTRITNRQWWHPGYSSPTVAQQAGVAIIYLSFSLILPPFQFLLYAIRQLVMIDSE